LAGVLFAPWSRAFRSGAGRYRVRKRRRQRIRRERRSRPPRSRLEIWIAVRHSPPSPIVPAPTTYLGFPWAVIKNKVTKTGFEAAFSRRWNSKSTRSPNSIFQLKVATSAESVEVTGAAPILQPRRLPSHGDAIGGPSPAFPLETATTTTDSADAWRRHNQPGRLQYRAVDIQLRPPLYQW